MVKSKFRKWQKEHPNFMTPYVIKTKSLKDEKGNDYIVELSEGTGFENNKIYGVSILKANGEKFETIGHPYEELSKSFNSKEEAERHYDAIYDLRQTPVTEFHSQNIKTGEVRHTKIDKKFYYKIYGGSIENPKEFNSFVQARNFRDRLYEKTGKFLNVREKENKFILTEN